MLGYIKLKNTNEELYETDFLTSLKEKNTKFACFQYWICYLFYEAVVKLKYLGNIITVKEIYNAYLFIFPFSVSEKQKKIKRCMKKITRLMKKYKINTIVLSEELKEIQKDNLAINREIHFLNGTGVMPYLIREMLEYILGKQGTNMELEDLYICIKELKKIYIDNIFYLASYFKTINIITPNISNLQRIADKIEEKENVIITVTNNKKKSLKKAKIIVNFDFNEKEMKKYNVYRRAIIVSIEEEKRWSEDSSFDGIHIQQLSIDISSELKELFQKHYLLKSNNLTTLYESIINKKQGFLKVKEQMQKDQVRVIKLYGRKGEIQEKEYIEKVS